jgi:transposase
MSTSMPRLLYGQRHQVELRCESLDQLLPPDHPARAVWAFVGALDLGPLLAGIGSLPGQAGAPAYDPRILLAVWLYATIEGVGSSRELEELCADHLAYRWLCGGLAISYRTLSGFRTGHGAFLDRLLTQTAAALLKEGLIELKRVAQDGLKVRAAAGASSFRRPATIERCLDEARAQVEALRSQVDEDAGAAGRRAQAAKERAAADRLQRLAAARRELAALQAANAEKAAGRRRDPAQLRTSTTDPQARKMKMADGGFRPAYNVQLATTTAGGVIVGVDVSSAGADAEQMPPMLGQIEARFAAKPAEVLVDGGFASRAAIGAAEGDGTAVYAPVKEARQQVAAGRDPYARKKGDTDATAAWRARMGTAEARAIYKQRASTAEWVNAQARNRGLDRVAVRGRAKVLVVVLWYALAHNFGRMLALRAAQAAGGAEAASPPTG